MAYSAETGPTREDTKEPKKQNRSPQRRPRRRRLVVGFSAGALVLATGVACSAWIGLKAKNLETELTAAVALVPQLKAAVLEDDPAAASSTVANLKRHTAEARNVASDPLWTLAGALPWIGVNFQVATEVATAADDVAQLGAAPLVDVFKSLAWESLMPSGGDINIETLRAAEPKIVSASHAVKESSNRLDSIKTDALMRQIAEPLEAARTELKDLSRGLDAAADAASTVPTMLGADRPRHYLLMIQNNAELRASGGIPGALAVLTVDNGKLALIEQNSATALGPMSPILAIESEQKQIFSGRLGKFMQDVNLTPDFPTAARSAQGMWEQKTGRRVDGVLSLDPVALRHILDATGPIQLSDPEIVSLAGRSLPTELNATNVVRTLLSDVYAEIPTPALQDVYFAGVAKEVFETLSTEKVDSKRLLDGLVRATGEGRILMWSATAQEESVLSNYAISGSVNGPSVLPAQFGVYFNDGTGAKMDYYVKRTVQLVKQCAKDGYEQTSVRITSVNTAPADAATSLPSYVTGNGNYGVPAGSVQTNIVAYGPAQANVETAQIDGERSDFAPYLHNTRPVGVLTVRLAPGESRTVEFTFGKIVQHTEPNVVVTPTVQDVKDVTLPTQNAVCAPTS